MDLKLSPSRAGLPARELLHLMALAREGDRREGILLRQGKGWFQVSGMGHEALAALAYTLQPDDYLFPYYRDRALILARGVSNYELALAYFAKRHSSSGGRQMPGHFSDHSRNLFSVATPTASQCLPAAGAAWGIKMENGSQVVVTTVGDAAIRQGEFYEALAFALQESLPLVFVIEDNRYGISTPTEKFFPYRLGALGEGCLRKLDARDPRIVLEAGREAVMRARNGFGPTVLWCELDRLCSHTSSDDQRLYRPSEDIACDLERDPIQVFAASLIADGTLRPEEWTAELEDIVRRVDDDYRAAEKEEDPLPEEAEMHLFSAPSSSSSSSNVTFDVESGSSEAHEATTMVNMVNQTLKKALESNPRVVLFGEDIEDPKGGVFGVTKGLSKQFPTRVMNSPLAEATIVGAGTGLAASGWRPVFEVQFIDFIGPALNQLMNQSTSLRWRTEGDWTCPLVLLAPYGAYLPGGSLWHSESNEGIWAHIHGLNVVIPSTPEDAAGLLMTAIQGSDPTLYLLPKHIFRKRMDCPINPQPVPFGKAVVRRPGEDVTLVSWGNCMELAEAAAETMAEEGISLELIDLRSIAPCDYETVAASLSKTGRLVVVHEDGRTTGFGQCLIAEMTSRPEWFNYFLSSPQLVARKDTPIPYNPILEYAVLPDLPSVLEAVRITLQ